MYDISNQKKVKYAFANIKNSRTDIMRTKKVLTKTLNVLNSFFNIDSPPSSVTLLQKDNLSCRIITYNFTKLLSDKNIFAVVFYGNRRESLSKYFIKKFFNTDWEIAMSIKNNGNVLCYISQELASANWLNIVLFSKEDDKKALTANKKHIHASYTLAPKRFSWVRLHNAVLPDGVSRSMKIELTKTKYYLFDKMWFALRSY